ncbi:hypothetical protein BH11MYX4_BH11MYX4_48090 [soil metagenome]
MRSLLVCGLLLACACAAERKTEAPAAPPGAGDALAREAPPPVPLPDRPPAPASVVPEAGPPADATPPWADAPTCSFPPVSPAEGTTAKQCCHPAPDVTLCLETHSQLHNHELGPYTERLVSVTRGSRTVTSFPLDRQSHGSMKLPDVVMARLSFRVQPTGLALEIQSGCKGVCSGRPCSGEPARVAAICASAGEHRWTGERLERANPLDTRN